MSGEGLSGEGLRGRGVEGEMGVAGGPAEHGHPELAKDLPLCNPAVTGDTPRVALLDELVPNAMHSQNVDRVVRVLLNLATQVGNKAVQ